MGGKTAWVAMTTVMLFGVPYAIAYSDEQQLIEMENEMKMREMGGEVCLSLSYGDLFLVFFEREDMGCWILFYGIESKEESKRRISGHRILENSKRHPLTSLSRRCSPVATQQHLLYNISTN